MSALPRDAVCTCNHWSEEHGLEGVRYRCNAPGCGCVRFCWSDIDNTAEALAWRGGEHRPGCRCALCQVQPPVARLYTCDEASRCALPGHPSCHAPRPGYPDGGCAVSFQPMHPPPPPEGVAWPMESNGDDTRWWVEADDALALFECDDDAAWAVAQATGWPLRYGLFRGASGWRLGPYVQPTVIDDFPDDTCPECNGEGSREGGTYWCCRGSIWAIECACGGQPQVEVITCEECHGHGRLRAPLLSPAAG